MARFNATEGIAFRSIRAACYQELDVAQLLMAVGQKLQRLTGSDSFCSCQIDPAITLITYAVSEGWPDEVHPMLIEHVIFRSKAADAPLMLKEGLRTVNVEDLLSDLDKPLEDPYFQYHLLPFGYRHEVELFCTAKGSAYAVLTLSRKDSSGRFDERLMPLLDALAPHVAEGIARATVREALASPHGTDIGMMILDENGKVEMANGAAETWLSFDSRKHWPLGLPLFAAMVARRTPGTERLIDEPFIDLPHPETGALYRLHWEQSQGPDERPRSIILMEPIRHGDSSKALTRLGLTPREADVALALVRGLAVKEIAAELLLSPHTVTDYMKNIFYKLDVSSRSELAALLMGSANLRTSE